MPQEGAVPFRKFIKRCVFVADGGIKKKKKISEHQVSRRSLIFSCLSFLPLSRHCTSLLCPLTLSLPLWQCVGSIQPLTRRGRQILTGLGWRPFTAAPPRDCPRQRWPRQRAKRDLSRGTAEPELATATGPPTGSWCAVGLWSTRGVWWWRRTA